MNAIRAIPQGAIRILGLDPGLRKTGWGVVEAHGARLSHIAHGVIAPKDTLPFAERLLVLFDAIAQVIALHAPDEAAVEETFMNNNAQSALKLGHARACWWRNTPPPWSRRRWSEPAAPTRPRWRS
jgi:crossover junction endodeoxyribonuclease RuvC